MQGTSQLGTPFIRPLPSGSILSGDSSTSGASVQGALAPAAAGVAGPWPATHGEGAPAAACDPRRRGPRRWPGSGAGSLWERRWRPV